MSHKGELGWDLRIHLALFSRVAQIPLSAGNLQESACVLGSQALGVPPDPHLYGETHGPRDG